MDSNEAEELGGAYVLTVDELGQTGLWDSVKEVFEARSPLQQITLHNKVGRAVQLDKLPIQFVQVNDKRLLRLKPFSHSQVVWFRNPYVHIVLVSSADINEYRAHIKAQVRKALADVEREWGGPTLQSEWMIVFLRPQGLDPQDKGANKVYDKLMDDFGMPTIFSSAQRATGPRVVGLSLPPRRGAAQLRGVMAYGLEELDHTLHARVRTAFEDRQAGYVNEIKSLSNKRLDPGWSFAMFYLVKDSFGLMLEMAGMWADALQEYVELETCYTESLSRGAVANNEFGSTTGEGDDSATLMTAPWRHMRRAVLKRNTVPEFAFRQYLFAAQSRLLLRMGRPLDTAERGIRFIGFMGHILEQHLAVHPQLPGFKEAWVFSACMSLISSTIAAATRELPESDMDSSISNSSPGAAATASGRPGHHARVASSGSLSSLYSSNSSSCSGMLPVKTAVIHPAKEGSEDSGSAASPLQLHDWHLGVCMPADLMPPHVDTNFLGAAAIQPTRPHLVAYSRRPELQSRDATYCKFFLALAHLYDIARQQLVSLGKIAHPTGPPPQRQQQQLPQQTKDLMEEGLYSLFAGHYAGSSDFESRFEATPSRAQSTQQQVLMAMLMHASTAAAPPPASQARLPPRLSSEHGHGHSGLGRTAGGGRASDVHASGLAGTMSEGSNVGQAQWGRMPQVPGIGRAGSGQEMGGSRRGSSPETEAAPPMMTISSANDPPPTHAADTHATPHHEAPAAAAAHAHAAGGHGAAPQLPQHCGYHVHSAAAASRQLQGGGLRSLGAVQVSGSGPQLQPQQQQQQQLQQAGSWEVGLPKWAQLVPEVKASSSWAPLPSPVLVGAVEAGALEDLTLGLGQHCARQRPFFPGAAAAAKAAGLAHLNHPSGVTSSALPTNGDGAPVETEPASKTGTSGAEAAAFTPPVHLQWVTDWRLRAALSSPELWEDLLLQLRVVSAVCLSNAGRPRNAALLWADVGLLLLGLGHARMAHRMLDNLCMTAAVERWDAIMALLLPHMIRCQSLLGHVMLPFTCLRYLGLLPEGASNPVLRQQVLGLLLQCTHPIDGLSPWTQAGIQLHAMHALQVAPAAGCFSWFYGSGGKTSPVASANASSKGAPPQWASLHPAPHRLGPKSPQAQGTGGAKQLHTQSSSSWGAGEDVLGHEAQHMHQQQQQHQQQSQAAFRGACWVHVGELVPVCVDVWSNLPEPITLTDPSLALHTLVQVAASQPPPPSPVSSVPGNTVPAPMVQQHRPDASPVSSTPPSTWPTPPPPHHQRNHSTGQPRAPPPLLSPAASTANALTTSAPGSSAASVTDAGPLELPGHPLQRPSHSSSVSDLSTASEPASAHSHASTHILTNRSDFGAVASPPHARPFLSPPHHRSSYDSSALRAPAHSLPSASTTNSTGSFYSPLYAHLHPTGSQHHPHYLPAHATPPTSDTHHAYSDIVNSHSSPAPHPQQHLQKQHAAGADSKTAGSKDHKAAGSRQGWADGPDLGCRVLLRVEALGGASAGTDATAASAMPLHPSPAAACGSAPAAHGAPAQGLVQEGSMARPLKVAVLHPGWNRLTFLAAPVVPGLCLIHHMSALLGTCNLHIQAAPPPLRRSPTLSAAPPPLPPPPVAAGQCGVPGAMNAGTVGLGGDGVSREAVVLAVADVQPRMSMAAVAMGGSLVAGAQQWLGVAVIPCQDTPSHLRLALLPRTKGLLRVGDHCAQPAEDLLLPVGPGGALHGGLGRWGTSAAAAAAAGAAASAATAAKSNALPKQVQGGSRAVAAPRRPRLWGLHPACVWDEGACWPSASGMTVDQGSTKCRSSSSQGDAPAGNAVRRRADGAVAESCCVVLAPLAAPSSRQQQQQPEVQCRLLRGCLELNPKLLGQPCLEQPALLWLPVCVPPLLGWQTQLEVVQVESNPAAGGMLEGEKVGGSSGAAQSQAEGKAEEEQQQQHQHHHQLQQPSCPTAELDVALEYRGSDSCWRSHTSLISVPLRQPFLVFSQARALADSTMLLTMRLQYQGTQPAVLYDAHLAPQDGFAVVSAAAPSLFPACVHPGTYLNLSFVLSMGVQYVASSSRKDEGVVATTSSAGASAADAVVPAANGKAAELEEEDGASAAAALAMAHHFGVQESKLIVTYGVTTDAPHTSRPEEVPACGKQRRLCSEDSPLPLPMPPLLAQPPSCMQPQDDSPRSPACNAESEGSSGTGASVSSQVHGSKLEESGPLVFSWAFRLQGPATCSATLQQAGAVAVHFLGPFVGHVDEPITLSWQVTRTRADRVGREQTHLLQHGAEDGQSGVCGVHEEETELIGYDIEQPCCPGQQQQQHMPSWHMAAGCRGVLRLGVQPGALGVVETVVAPMQAGLLHPPHIIFHGLLSGSASPGQAQTHQIHVLPA